MRKTRDCFKKIRDTKGNIRGKMGTMNDIKDALYGPNRNIRY